jgi:hypothetical protein
LSAIDLRYLRLEKQEEKEESEKNPEISWLQRVKNRAVGTAAGHSFEAALIQDRNHTVIIKRGPDRALHNN